MADLNKTIENKIRELNKAKSKISDFEEEAEQIEAIKQKIRDTNEAYYEALLLKKDGKKLTDKQNHALETGNQLRKERNDLVEIHNLKEKAAAEFVQKQNKSLSENFKIIKNGALNAYGSLNTILQSWGKASQAAADYAKKIGLSQKGMENLRKGTIAFANAQQIGINYNKSIDELIKLQEGYSSKIGRSISATNEQRESLAAMSAVIGDDMAVDFAAKLENFGLSATEAGNRMGKMFKQASKDGIAVGAYTKNVADNLNIAQNYTFKNGLRGLMSMAEKATAIKLNMSQASAFADKVNTVEGAIKTGAQLQVLGGPFTQFSNPMSMLYESWNDLEGLQDRITKMYGNLGKWNERTGEVEISALNKMRMRQFAQATGMDYSNLMESLQATTKMNEIDRRYKSQLSGLSKSDQNFIRNKATYDNETKNWGLSDKDGNFISIDRLVSDKEKLQEVFEINRSESDDIKEIAVLLRGWDDIFSGSKKQGEAGLAQIGETLGIGKFMLKTVQNIGENTGLITAILGGREIYNLGKGIFDMFGGGKGAFGKLRRGVTGKRNFGSKNMPKNPEPGYEKYFDDLKKNGGKVGRRGPERAAIRRSIKKDILKGRALKGLKGSFRVGTGVAGGVGLATDFINNTLTNSGVIKKGGGVNKALNIASRGLEFAGLGGQIGSFVGPIGTAIGAILGGAIGTYLGHRKNVRNTQETKIAESGLSIQGDYTIKTLKKINKVLETGDLSNLRDKDIRRLKENNEYEQLVSFVKSKYSGPMSADIDNANMNVNSLNINGNSFTNGEVKMAKDGLLNGPSHAEGGMKILGTNRSVEGGEFVINKKSTKKYFNELSRINSDSTPIKPIEPLGKIMTVSKPYGNLSHSVGVNSVKIEPISISLNGTIKLDTGGQKVDITESLLSNPVLIKTLTNMITKQINKIENNGAFDKGNFKQKWV